MASKQRRWGPQRSGLGGVLQPFWDGLKLGVKQPVSRVGSGAFVASPVVAFVLSQVAWCGVFVLDAAFQALVIMALSSLAVYAVMLAGWSSHSKYAFLGCLRSVALMVSYELSLGAALLSVAICSGSLNWATMLHTEALYLLAALFLICAVAETKRVPFDLLEAETELVAGYHVEYSSLGFALFCMAVTPDSGQHLLLRWVDRGGASQRWRRPYAAGTCSCGCFRAGGVLCGVQGG